MSPLFPWNLVSSRWPVLGKASIAVNRPAFRWLEWHVALSPAVRAGCLVHFAWAAVPAAVSTVVPVSAVSIVVVTHLLYLLKSRLVENRPASSPFNCFFIDNLKKSTLLPAINMEERE